MTRHAVQHSVPRTLCRRMEPVGTAKLRRLGERHQQRCLAEGQPARLLAEIGKRGRPDPFEIPAIGREGEVQTKDLVLGQLRSSSMARTASRSLM